MLLQERGCAMIIRRWIKLTDTSGVAERKEDRNRIVRPRIAHTSLQRTKRLSQILQDGCAEQIGIHRHRTAVARRNRKDSSHAATVRYIYRKSGSLADDTNYQKTIADKDNYFPSPSVFVYTLPQYRDGRGGDTKQILWRDLFSRNR